MTDPDSDRRTIPSVDKIIQALAFRELPHEIVLFVVREYVNIIRKKRKIPAFDLIVTQLRKELRAIELRRIKPTVNGSGVILHTNLGRAPLAPQVVQYMSEIGQTYSNLEMDLPTGNRGNRGQYLELCLSILCRSESAIVVNNCAAALILVIRHFTSGDQKSVIISRGELIQIGGGFRIPEILESSGAYIREVGTTNRTTVKDYERAINRDTALILKVHRSNFAMEGFVESPTTENIKLLANTYRLPLIEDLGSGALVDTAQNTSLEHEPTPAEVLRKGVDLVCFSGDKLMGGPQAGIIAGKEVIVDALKKEPFFRALRSDKLILAALQSTAELYLRQKSNKEIPVFQMLHDSVAKLRKRGEKIARSLKGLPIKIHINDGESQIGGGALPKSSIPSVTIDLAPTSKNLELLTSELRQGTPPVIGYISNQHLRLDLRTIFETQDESLSCAIRSALESKPTWTENSKQTPG